MEEEILNDKDNVESRWVKPTIATPKKKRAERVIKYGRYIKCIREKYGLTYNNYPVNMSVFENDERQPTENEFYLIAKVHNLELSAYMERIKSLMK